VGAGVGSVTRWLADRVRPRGSVVAANLKTGGFERLVDDSSVEVRRLGRRDGELPSSEFDLVHSRFTLGQVAEREQLLDRLIGAARPDGWVMVTDLDWRTIEPASPDSSSRRVADGVRAVLSLAGMDLGYGQRLPSSLERHGLVAVEGRGAVRYCHGGSIGPHIHRLVIERSREEIVASGHASHQEIDEVEARLLDPHYAGLSPTIWTAWGRRPAT
jgi:Methyltransferase domain